jgi:hypothetical protein
MTETNFCEQPGMVNFKNSKLLWIPLTRIFRQVQMHSEDDEAPTLNIYASEHEIPIEWQAHILENALAAFHEDRTSLHMAASNGHVDIVSYTYVVSNIQEE